MVVLIALVVFGGLWVWAMQRPSSWQILLSQTVEQGEVDTLFAELQRKPELVQPRFFDEAMHWLIQSDVKLAAELTVRFLPVLPDHKVSQEWLEFMSSQEGVSDSISSEFLERYRRTGCNTGSG